MPNATYEELLLQVSALSPSDQLRLIADLSKRLRAQILPARPRTLLELEGLGKEIWQGTDAQEYVNQERDS